MAPRSKLDRPLAGEPQEESAVDLAVIVAGEDLRIGDDVAVLNETLEVPSCLWNCDEVTLPAHEPVRVRFASRDPGVPLRVAALCLPFVCLETPKGTHKTVDLRLVELVRVSSGYAKAVRKALKHRVR